MGTIAVAILTCQTPFCSLRGTQRTGSGNCPGCYSKTLQLNSCGFLLHIHQYLRRRNQREKDMVSNHNLPAVMCLQGGLCVHEKQVRVWFCELRSPTSAAWCTESSVTQPTAHRLALWEPQKKHRMWNAQQVGCVRFTMSLFGFCCDNWST